MLRGAVARFRRKRGCAWEEHEFVHVLERSAFYGLSMRVLRACPPRSGGHTGGLLWAQCTFYEEFFQVASAIEYGDDTNGFLVDAKEYAVGSDK